VLELWHQFGTTRFLSTTQLPYILFEIPSPKFFRSIKEDRAHLIKPFMIENMVPTDLFGFGVFPR